MLESAKPGILNIFYVLSKQMLPVQFQYPEKDLYLSYSPTWFSQQISLSLASFYNVELLCRKQLIAALNSIIWFDF